ncbi:MAG: imidazolonepropionase-like amidohydrolase/Tol biopolymer transport system component [Saprospiraceae bacterium]|jgi:imidazolonepropionase-like amidohydrolase/Tol biopolymer transport system component
MRKYLLICLVLLTATLLSAQKDKKDKKWDVANPPGNFKEVTINTDEGTWMNLDVSPDGKTIVFDLLGDIYQMPLTGGKAEVLRSGLPWEVQPRFSADGKKLLFTSDAGGGDNIWTMDADGKNAKQVTKEDFRLLNNGIWTPDGQYIIARKHFTSQRSLGAGEMWMYHISGGSGIQLTKRKNDQQDVNEPSISSDGRYLYYSEDMYPGGNFQYNKNPNSQIYVIKRYDLEKGKTETAVSGPGGACRPQISNDGKWLAYVRRIRTKSVLFIQNLETGEEYELYDKLSKDQQEAWAVFGVYTGFDWTPDDQNIIIWAGGKIRSIDVKTKAAKEIPFEVNAIHKLAETVHFEQDAAPENFQAKAIRHTVTSPDGKFIVFNAVGKIWKMDLPNGTAQRLSKAEGFEFEPSFSPDGKSIVYVSWNDEEMGAIIKMDLATKSTKKLTAEKGIYRTPCFSPDGKQVVYRKEGGNYHQGFLFTKKPGIYLKSSTSVDEGELVTAEGEYPRFSTEGDRIFYQTGGYLFGSLTKSYHSVKPDGSDKNTLFNTKYGNLLAPSPDNKWIAFSELQKVYIAPMPMTGQPVGLTADTKAVPVAQVARDAGISLHWSADSKNINWTLGNEYYSNAIEDRFPFLGKVDSVPPIDTTGILINVPLQLDKPTGMIAFVNARIITMEGDQVIEDGTIIVEENKIKSVGKSVDIRVPKGAKVIDAKGKTIMPGIVDVHSHLGAFRYGLSPQKHWQYYANLAYGITTTHDPSSNTEMTFSQSEMVKTGAMVGPRIFSTGTILYGADGDFKAVINNLDDARSALRRTKAFGAFSVKSYNQPRREQRQQVIQAARELGINVYPEGGSFLYHNLSMVADGHTGVEHNIPVAPLFDDVIKFWSATNSGNTPTLIVNYGGLNGEYYWYQNTNVWEDEKLLAFTPRAIIDSRSRHRTMVPDEEYQNGHILVSQSCTKLQNAGVNINLGSHGQIQGIGAHWELWMLQQGGMSNLQALKAATINGARYIGMEKQIGSIKTGKLADLIVLDKNPIKNIQNSNSVVYTMINGRLYDAATMNEVGNQKKERTPFYWEIKGSGNAYPPLIEGTNVFMSSGCSCRQ